MKEDVILVLAGTVEGRELIKTLNEQGYPVIGSVSTEYGAELLAREGCSDIIQGNLDIHSLKDLIKHNKVKFIIDATHPFASIISGQAMEAAKATDIKYLRLERKSGIIPNGPLIKTIRELEEAEPFIKPGMRVFSTLGSKSLSIIVPIVSRCQAELVVRVLPTSQVIIECEKLGLNPDQIVALSGPFNMETNRELFKKYNSDLILTKESGDPGGLGAKITAAAKLNITTVVWLRPIVKYPIVFNSVASVVEYLCKY